MYFCHVAEIWQDFPQLVAGVLVLEAITPHAEVEPALTSWFDRARQRLEGTTEGQLAEVSAWRRAYAQMGLKPTQYRSAAEALLRRFRREDDLPRLHPLVDLCNAVSLAFALPVAVFDLAQVDQFLQVRRAIGSESYLAFSGEIETPPPDEVIFADGANHVHARRWTFRQSRQSVIMPETQRVLIVSEGLHDTADRDVAALIEALVGEFAAFWSPPTHKAILSATQPKLVF
jgi:DNA/RNA-binding domain of Phe-tRNA-synthetase-like protein